MREKLLEIKKEITELKDNYEQLSFEDREKLKELEFQEKMLRDKMNKEDLEFVDEEYAKWLKAYIDLITKIIIKPGEDC
jgi:uncharacterized membrane protein (DUF106 family)